MSHEIIKPSPILNLDGTPRAEKIGVTTKNAVIRQKISKKIGKPCTIAFINFTHNLTDVMM